MNMVNSLQQTSLTPTGRLLAACAASCRTFLNRIQSVKRGLLHEFGHGRGSDHVLRLALNEAEALAHESGFPMLIFPVLAREKAEAVAAWHRHQEAVRQSSSHLQAA